LCVVGGKWIKDVFDHFPQLAGDPVGVGDDERQTVFVVGEIDRVVEPVAQKDAFPGDVQQSAVVPEFVQDTVGVTLFNEDDVSVPVEIVWMAFQV
jgi:hypothetical protein